MYILECADKSFYVGSTVDLERRVSEHQNGLGAKYTKRRLPVKLVFAEEFDRIDEAYYLEKQVQGWSRKKRIALINRDFTVLKELVRCQKVETLVEPCVELDETCRNQGKVGGDFFVIEFVLSLVSTWFRLRSTDVSTSR